MPWSFFNQLIRGNNQDIFFVSVYFNEPICFVLVKAEQVQHLHIMNEYVFLFSCLATDIYISPDLT